MGLVAANCTQCGAPIEVDDTKESGVCGYCGTPYVTKKIINIFNHGPSEINLLNRADDFFQKRDYTKALEYYNRVLDINIDNKQAKIGTLKVKIIQLENSELKQNDKKSKLKNLYNEYLLLDKSDLTISKKLYCILMAEAMALNDIDKTREYTKKLISVVYKENPDNPVLSVWFKKYYIGKRVVSYWKVNELIRQVESHSINAINILVNEYDFDYYQADFFIHKIKFNDIGIYETIQNIPSLRPTSFPTITGSLKKHRKGVMTAFVSAIKEGNILEIFIGLVGIPVCLLLELILIFFKILSLPFYLISAIFSPLKTAKKIFGGHGAICYMCEDTVKTRDAFFTNDNYAFHKNCILSTGIEFSEKYVSKIQLKELIYVIMMFRGEINQSTMKKKFSQFVDKISMYD